jgi:hypothetical protein
MFDLVAVVRAPTTSCNALLLSKLLLLLQLGSFRLPRSVQSAQQGSGSLAEELLQR